MRHLFWMALFTALLFAVGCPEPGDDDASDDDTADDDTGDDDVGDDDTADDDTADDDTADDDTADDDTADDDTADDDTADDDTADDDTADDDTGDDDTAAAAPPLVDHRHTDLSTIPAAWIDQAQADLHVVYQHTSHGSQLISGMNALESFPAFGSTYDWDDSGLQADALDLDDYGIPGCADLSQGDYIDKFGVTPWVTATRALLDLQANSHVNVVMWSWCSINGHDAQRYVDNMEILVAQYPNVHFIFMTGHAQGQGEDLTPDSVHYNNELIRQHCIANDRWLFDFADIEAYDPDGVYFWDLNLSDNLDYTGGNWAEEWITANPGTELEQLTTGNNVPNYSGCTSCSHSDSPSEATLNCVLKGRASWWLFARLAGWDGN